MVEKVLVFLPPTQGSTAVANHAYFDIVFATKLTQGDKMLVHGDFTACELKIQFFTWVLFFYFEYKSFDIFKFRPAFAAVVQYGRTIAATEITGVA
jgi:hypothetical protein